MFARERKRALTTLLAPHRGEIGHADFSLAIESAYAIYSSTMRGRLIYYVAPTTPSSVSPTRCCSTI